MSVAPRYFLIDDFAPHRSQDDFDREDQYVLSYSPYCVICVFPLALPASASRAKLSPDLKGRSTSVSDDPAEGVKLRDNPLIITDDILSATVQTSKGSYLHHLQFTLCKSPINYLSSLLPGDWVMCWMVASREKGRDIIKRLKRLEPCNGFRDGLKFLGRVRNVGRDRTTDRGSGLTRVTYSISAAGFYEFSSQIFYDPVLAQKAAADGVGMGSWLAKIGLSINNLLSKGGAIDINKLIPEFFQLLLGEGVSSLFANPTNSPELQALTGLQRRDSLSAPYAFTAPGPVGQVLGRNPSTLPSHRSVLAYANLIELLIGIQRFTSAAGQEASAGAPWSIFTPDGIEPEPAPVGETPLLKATNTRLIGEFIPTGPDFTNKDVWTILRQWLNPTINEMYTVLRTNESGQVIPTLVVRQLPLSTQATSDKLGEHPSTTPLLALPRWVGHPAIVSSDSLTRSDDLRFNFIHIMGQPPQAQQAIRITGQLVQNPPIRNDLDCQRAGLRSYMATVNCSTDQAQFGPTTWMTLAGDWLLDQHLVLGGTVSMELIEAPIVHGDAFEYNGVVSMIEGVTHHFEVVGGQTRAMTRLGLTHGVRSDDDPAYQEKDGTDAYLFAGLRNGDCQAYDPGVFTEIERVTVQHQSLEYEPPPSE